MERGKTIRTIVIMAVVVLLLVVVYIRLTKEKADATAAGRTDDQVIAEMTTVQKLIAESGYQSYPATPVQVVKRYNEIMCCFYNETWTEGELNILANMLRSYFDEELVAQQTDEEYLAALKEDIIPFINQKITIYSAEVTPSTDVEFFDYEGYECARLYCTYQLKQMVSGNIAYAPRYQVFILRKDADGHWKILGFKDAEEEMPGMQVLE